MAFLTERTVRKSHGSFRDRTRSGLTEKEGLSREERRKFANAKLKGLASYNDIFLYPKRCDFRNATYFTFDMI